mmetsp:Transcript_110109/g.194639  ORF Transcript_110109/g.194639 Transcript_110109/m.194639 type:complete len:292 (-) Transcript_110109:19-894(-)
MLIRASNEEKSQASMKEVCLELAAGAAGESASVFEVLTESIRVFLGRGASRARVLSNAKSHAAMKDVMNGSAARASSLFRGKGISVTRLSNAMVTDFRFGKGRAASSLLLQVALPACFSDRAERSPRASSSLDGRLLTSWISEAGSPPLWMAACSKRIGLAMATGGVLVIGVVHALFVGTDGVLVAGVAYVVDRPGVVDAIEAESDGGVTTNDVKASPPFGEKQPRACNVGLEDLTDGDFTRTEGLEDLTDIGMMILTGACGEFCLGYGFIPRFELILRHSNLCTNGSRNN